MKYKLIIFLLFYFNINTFSQIVNEGNIDIITKSDTITFFQECGFDNLYQQALSDNEIFAKNIKKIETRYIHSIYSNIAHRGNTEVIVLPIVVHIIHNNGAENISDNQVFQGIKNLNDAFRNREYYNPKIGVDTKIEFCLAQRDTSGKKINGIIRHLSELTDMSLHHSNTKLSELATFDTDKYINIRLVKEACLGSKCARLSGYAVYGHSASSQQNGIVMEARYFGSSSANGVVATHEIGHFLGLHHTFKGGCTNNNCLEEGDKVCDTPPDKITGNFPCLSVQNSCFTDTNDNSINNPLRKVVLGGLGDQNDLSSNYMDYSSFNCYNNFTQGQSDRMHFLIDNYYNSLVNSKACLPPCESITKSIFTTVKDTILIGEFVFFKNESINSNSFSWYIDGFLFSQQKSPSYQFLSIGSHKVTLVASNDDIKCDSNVYSKDIFVYCPLKTDINYLMSGDYLVFNTYQDANTKIFWTVLNSTDTLFQSNIWKDSFKIENSEFVYLCLELENNFCDENKCIYIQFKNDESEICNNEKDDDGDNLIDYFDPDCPCSDTLFQAYCPIECEYIPDSFPDLKMKLKWKSEILSDSAYISPNLVVGDINGDGLVEILSAQSYGNQSDKNSISSISIFNGKSGFRKNEFHFTGDTVWSSSTYIAIGDINQDGLSEIFFWFYANNTVKCLTYNGNLLWESPSLPTNRSKTVNLVDFNGDGIPEVYIGNVIINAQTGVILLKGNEGIGCNKPGYSTLDLCFNSHIVAADVLPNPGLELCAGNTVYEINIMNKNGTLGNTIIPTVANKQILDGYTGVSDIDFDGQLDIIIIRDKNFSDGGGIWVWNPRTNDIIAKADAGESGGIPFIGDIDGDCIPEIGMTFINELRMYKYDGTKNLKLMYSIPTTDNSGFTGITMFDFNQDGKNELIYRDETDLRIIEGKTGLTLSSVQLKSGTGYEYPIVADIDNDGQAEIVVNGYLDNSQELRIFAFESAGAPWAPARSVWNQTAYNVTNVNDDLTIPRHPQNPAAFIPDTDSCASFTCPQVYNNFMTQATYRTQQGCVQFPTVDLLPKLIDWQCNSDSIILSYVVYNISDAIAALNTYGVSVYDNNPLINPANLLNNKNIDLAIGIGSISDDTFNISIPYQSISRKLYLVINDKSTLPSPLVFPLTDHPECNYSNNIDSILIEINTHDLNLGDDIVRCDNEVITLNAGEEFVSYQWSDGRMDSIFSTSFDGIVYLETIDECGISYYDSLEISTDKTSIISIKASVRNICLGDSIKLSVANDFDTLFWYYGEEKVYKNVDEINVVTDTSVLITAIGINGVCFSNDTVFIEVKQPIEIEEIINICEGESIFFDNKVLNKTGQYEYTDDKCDTLHKLNLIIDDTFYTENNIELCKGDSIYLFDQWINKTGTYTKVYSALSGCDSTLVYYIKTVDFIKKLDTVNICEGDSIFINGNWFKSEGKYLDTIVNNQCGIIQTTELIINKKYLFQDTFTLCPNESIEINGDKIKSTGIYKYKMSTVYGCDSIYIAKVEKLDFPPIPELKINCDKSEISVKIPNLNKSWDILWSNRKQETTTIYSKGDKEFVILSAEPNCELKYEFELPKLPDLNQLPFFTDTILDPITTFSLKLDLDTNEWKVEWNPVEIVDCSTCMNVKINAEKDVNILIKLIHTSGCIYTKSFRISQNINEDIYIPNIFSPDGDNLNDSWHLTFKKFKPTIIEAAIFNRWGEKIIEWKNVTNLDWDGTFKGKEANQGVYVYYIKYKNIKGKEIILKGDVTIIR